jgi:hypothetical protein
VPHVVGRAGRSGRSGLGLGGRVSEGRCPPTPGAAPIIGVSPLSRIGVRRHHVHLLNRQGGRSRRGSAQLLASPSRVLSLNSGILPHVEIRGAETIEIAEIIVGNRAPALGGLVHETLVRDDAAAREGDRTACLILHGIVLSMATLILSHRLQEAENIPLGHVGMAQGKKPLRVGALETPEDSLDPDALVKLLLGRDPALQELGADEVILQSGKVGAVEGEELLRGLDVVHDTVVALHAGVDELESVLGSVLVVPAHLLNLLLEVAADRSVQNHDKLGILLIVDDECGPDGLEGLEPFSRSNEHHGVLPLVVVLGTEQDHGIGLPGSQSFRHDCNTG